MIEDDASEMTDPQNERMGLPNWDGDPSGWRDTNRKSARAGQLPREWLGAATPAVPLTSPASPDEGHDPTQIHESTLETAVETQSNDEFQFDDPLCPHLKPCRNGMITRHHHSPNPLPPPTPHTPHHPSPLSLHPLPFPSPPHHHHPSGSCVSCFF